LYLFFAPLNLPISTETARLSCTCGFSLRTRELPCDADLVWEVYEPIGVPLFAKTSLWLLGLELS
jgi:hypothetical protein